jgi:hypothetical protein
LDERRGREEKKKWKWWGKGSADASGDDKVNSNDIGERPELVIRLWKLSLGTPRLCKSTDVSVLQAILLFLRSKLSEMIHKPRRKDMIWKIEIIARNSGVFPVYKRRN